MSSSTSRIQATKAFQSLTSEVRAAKSFGRFVSDFGTVLALIICYGYIAWLRGSSSTFDFLGILVIVLTLQAISDRRAQRRFELLVEALDQLQLVIEDEDT
jgi:hypothetical protein